MVGKSVDGVVMRSFDPAVTRQRADRGVGPCGCSASNGPTGGSAPAAIVRAAALGDDFAAAMAGRSRLKAMVARSIAAPESLADPATPEGASPRRRRQSYALST